MPPTSFQRRRPRVILMLLALCLSLLTPLIPVQQAVAQSLVVVNTLDNSASPDTGSLRQVLRDAPDGSTITFDIPGDGPHMIVLYGTELFVSGKAVTIQGPQDEAVTIDAEGLSRVFHVAAGAALTIEYLTITGGGGVGVFQGGGIYAQGDLTLFRSTVTNNSVSSSDGQQATGGGVRGESKLEIVESTISHNLVTSSGNGQARGGGIFLLSGTLDISGSTISNNRLETSVTSVQGHGGGLYVAGDAYIENSTIAGNSIKSAGTAQGHGLRVESSGEVTIVSSTISGNGAGDATTGAALWVVNGGSVHLQGSIVAGNTGGNCPVPSHVVSVANNIFGPAGCDGLAGSLEDPQLGELQDNGGPTWTMLPGPASPAIDVAGFTDCLEVDQRGVSRPAGELCDAGAVEVRVASISGAGSTQEATGPLGWQVEAGNVGLHYFIWRYGDQ